MRAIDDPVALAAGAAVFRRALARRAVSASAPVAPPVGGWRGASGGPRRRPATEARTA